MDELLNLARQEQLAVQWADLEGGLGRYILEQRLILLDRSLRFDRALCRAVLAHEIGHHMTRQYADDPSRWEAAARAWALRYLIPDSAARAAWRRAVEEVAEQHGVPHAWAAARLLEVIM